MLFYFRRCFRIIHAYISKVKGRRLVSRIISSQLTPRIWTNDTWDMTASLYLDVNFILFEQYNKFYYLLVSLNFWLKKESDLSCLIA